MSMRILAYLAAILLAVFTLPFITLAHAKTPPTTDPFIANVEQAILIRQQMEAQAEQAMDIIRRTPWPTVSACAEYIERDVTSRTINKNDIFIPLAMVGNQLLNPQAQFALTYNPQDEILETIKQYNLSAWLIFAFIEDDQLITNVRNKVKNASLKSFRAILYLGNGTECFWKNTPIYTELNGTFPKDFIKQVAKNAIQLEVDRGRDFSAILDGFDEREPSEQLFILEDILNRLVLEN